MQISYSSPPIHLMTIGAKDTMPIIKSAKKRVRQAEKNREHNVQAKRTLRENTRALEAAIETKSKKDIDKLLRNVYSSYDMAVKKNLIHKNKAARKKSHYSALVKELSPAKPKGAAKKKPAPKK